MKPGGLPAGNAKVGYSMDLPARTSPVGQPVALYVTCLVVFPGVGIASVRLLEHLGLTVTFPFAQTCCGQPAYNGGYHREARPLAERFLDVFRDVPVIVCPSGSCTTMIRVEYPRLFADDPIRAEQARAIAARTWELTEFLVDGLGRADLGLRLPEPQTFAIHDSCHGLRHLGLGRQARALIEAMATPASSRWKITTNVAGSAGCSASRCQSLARRCWKRSSPTSAPAKRQPSSPATSVA